MKRISVFEGKNRFSDVIASASRGEPQIITKNGAETAVVISIGEYRRLTAREKPLIKVLLDNPAHRNGMDIDLARDRDPGRDEIAIED